MRTHDDTPRPPRRRLAGWEAAAVFVIGTGSYIGVGSPAVPGRWWGLFALSGVLVAGAVAIYGWARGFRIADPPASGRDASDGSS